MFDASKIDIEKLGLEAACKKAYEQGSKDGFGNGFGAGRMSGFLAGRDDIMASFRAASSVAHVYRNGMHTIAEFEDGDKVRVTYDPSYGYAYDGEKAIMACMLKHLVGNDYISVLRKHGGYVPASHDGAMLTACTGMIVRPAVEASPEGTAVNDPDGACACQPVAADDPKPAAPAGHMVETMEDGTAVNDVGTEQEQEEPRPETCERAKDYDPEEHEAPEASIDEGPDGTVVNDPVRIVAALPDEPGYDPALFA